MKYLITGGAGFIGSHTVEGFLKNGHSVVVFDNFTSGHRSNLQHVAEKINIVEGDIRNEKLLEQACAGCNDIIHLAALTSVAESVQFPEKCLDVNVHGTFQVFNVARQMKLKRVVMASSCAVYGDAQSPPVSENGKTSPQSSYAASKLMGEALAESFYHAYGLESVCLRFFNVYGPRQRADSDYAAVVPKFIECYRNRQNPKVFGDGLQTRDFIHVTDVARALLLAATASGEVMRQQRVFNVGSGVSSSILDLLRVLDRVAESKQDHQFCPARNGEVRHSHADIKLSKDVLGFEASIQINDGLADLLK